MKVKILSCWFTTSYGTYTGGLRKARGTRQSETEQQPAPGQRGSLEKFAARRVV